MNYPLISEYIEAIKSAEDNFKELGYLRPVLGDDGLPVMSAGGFSIVFKMKDEQNGKFYAVKCFTKEQEGRAEAYREIAKELKDVSSPYLVSIQYLEKELFVDTDQTTETEFPILLMDWVEGKTLDKYLRENLDDRYALEMLAYRFSQLAQWLIPQPFAHGDLKPDNILVREDGTLVLVDYDGMYVPAMKGQKARELGSPDFRHPLRTESDFDEHIDDFPLVSILLSLKAISYDPQLLERYGAPDRLLFSEHNYHFINQSLLLKEIFPSNDSELNVLINLFMLVLEKKNLSYVSIKLLNLSSPENMNTAVTEDDFASIWPDEYGVVYSENGKRLLKGANTIRYSIREGTEIICDNTFENCKNLCQIVIPQSVKKIGSGAFHGCSQLKSASLPEGIVYLDWYTFSDCTNIETINLPCSLQSLWGNTFAGCSNLKIINLPEKLDFIGQGCFNDCLKLKSISLPNYINSIECNTFSGCKNLHRIKLPIHLESIGDGAFQNCSSLEYIVLPNTLSHIGQFAFSGCENLKFIIVSRPRKSYFEYLLPDNKEKLVEIDYEMEALETNGTEEIPNIWIDEYGAIYSADKRIFLKCPNIERYCIKEGAVVIAEEAFGECTKLMFLYIPSTIQDIKTTAFYRSYSNSIRLSENLSTTSQGYEFSCIQLQSIVIPYENKQKVKSLLPEHLRNILVEQKSGIEELCTKVTQEDWNNVWIDEYGATYSKDQKRLLRCPKVKTYNIVVGTKVIAEQAFKGCAELEEVQIPTSVELIGAQAFDSCWNLEKLEIPNSVKSIGKRCFEGCSSLQEIRIPEGITKIEDRTFEGCYKLQKVLLPDSLHEIGAYVFTICSISEIELPKQLKTIGYNAFWKAGITKLSIPNSVSRIDAGAFWHCSSLETIFLPPSLNEIKDETFFFCSKLSHIELPKSINKIGRSAFDGAKSLKSIVIPEGVTQIEYAAFATCYSLEEIKLPSTISHVGDKVFLDCPKLKKIRVPMGTKEVFTRLIPNYSNKIYEE